MKRLWTVLAVCLLLPASLLAAETTYDPFVLAAVTDASLEDQTNLTITALEAAGFKVVGHHSPRENAQVIVVTSPELMSIAALSDKGGYGAGQRVSVVRRDGATEVTFVNPLYIQHAYRLGGDMQPVYDQLAATLGFKETFGAEKNMTARKLAKYHYMVGMQRFDDPSELGTFDSYEAALRAVEGGLSRPETGLSQVYRIDIPGKNQTVFGIGMKAVGNEEAQLAIDEAHQLTVVDFEGPAKVAYFPYELLVDGNRLEALHMRFRMAVHFPDLSMMGKHGFTQLMSSPGATEDALKAMVTATAPPVDVTWIDVRSGEEFSQQHVPGALNIPYEEIDTGITALGLQKDAAIYLYCGSGRRAGIAKETLDKLGYSQVVNVGGLDAALAKAQGAPPN